MERHAILIVNDSFPDSDGALDLLSTVQDDFNGMTRVLNKLRSPPFKVTPVYNKSAWDIDDALKSVLKEVNGGEDLLLVYYAGHGRIQKEQGKSDSLLLATKNSAANPDNRFKDYKYSQIEELLKSHNVKRAVIILDCCYSGAAISENEVRGEGFPCTVPTPFSSKEYSLVPFPEAAVESPPSAQDMGDGVYILTACAPNQQAAGNTRTRSGEFTGHLLKALEGAMKGSLEAITLQAVFQDVFKAMKGLPQTPSLIKLAGEKRYLVIVPRGVTGEERNRSLTDWIPQPADRLARLNSVAPMYLLDSGFRFLHWNAVFEDVIANQLGLVIGCHAMEFVNRLENLNALTKRNPDIFPTPSREEIERANETGEIWYGFPQVDVERLDFLSKRFGLIVFDKLALQIHESNYRKSTTWQIELNVRFVQRDKDYWKNAEQVLERERLWTSYAESYDAVVQKYPKYKDLVKKVVRQVENCKLCLEIGAGTGNTTLALLNQNDGTVTAIESNDAMLEQLTKKLAAYGIRKTILKGDATTVVSRIFQERMDKNEPPEVFDACVMTNVLFALRDPGECLKSVFRVLKPGAILSLSTPRMDAPVELLMNSIRNWQSEHNRDEWLATNERAWNSALEINRRLGQLARDARHDLVTIKQLVEGAQFKILGNPVDDEYDGCVVLLKAIKPLFIPEPLVPQPLPPVTVPRLNPKPHQQDDMAPPIGGGNDHHGRQKIKLFLSYARRDGKVEEFLTKLKEFLAASKSYDYDIWKDNINVLVGEDWNKEIQDAINDCHLGLLMLSPLFLGSEYITEKELTNFGKDKKKPIIPVLLNEVDFKRMDLKGINSAQIFALDKEGRRLSYEKCRGSSKNDFVAGLFSQLEGRINKLREAADL